MTEREALNWEPIRKFWRNNSGANWDELETAIKEALAQPPEDRNFCPRCGKRAGKNAWDVHTCSLPEENT